MEINGKVGLGFRREMAIDLLSLSEEEKPAFVEFAPENWMGFGGHWQAILEKITAKFPVTTHGLSLSIGSPDDLDWDFLKQLKAFFKQFPVAIYSEHLSYSKCNNAHLYDLLPIPFREDAIKHIVKRIKIVQDFLEMPISIENVSYYATIGAEMSEASFIKNIVEESGCGLLLDINNVYINSFNHKYDAKEFLDGLPFSKVTYMHIAGHEKISDDLIIDTHGTDIIDPVFDLLEYVLPKIKPVPILLERDFNIPKMPALLLELSKVEQIVTKNWQSL